MEPVPDVFRFLPPYSAQNLPRESTPHFMTSEGMLMPSHMQPPPMYGPRGATVPPKFLGNYGKINNFQPRKSEFYCETCNRGFKLLTELEIHISKHEHCGIDGCPFIGHPLIVTKHIEQQHSSGLYDKLKNLNTPEDIAKWRDERKKRYPTRANVELRQQIQEEKIMRGERLDERRSRFGHRDDRRKCYNQNSRKCYDQNSRRRRRRYENSNKDVVMSLEIVKGDDSVSNRTFKKFEGTSNFADYRRPKTVVVNALTSLIGLYGSDDDSESDVDSNENQEASTKSTDGDNITSEEPAAIPKVGDNISKESSSESDSSSENCAPVVAPAQEGSDIINEEPVNAESNCFGDDDEQEDMSFRKTVENFNVIEERLLPTPTTGNHPSQEKNAVPHPDSSDSEDQQKEVPFEKVVETFPETEEQASADEPKLATSRKRIRKRQPTDESKSKRTLKHTTPGLNYSKLFQRRQNTMLEKLLQSDIIHERNVLLQCVRYVVQKKFFGIGQNK